MPTTPDKCCAPFVASEEAFHDIRFHSVFNLCLKANIHIYIDIDLQYI